MSREERNLGLATLGLALAGIGAFLPWARIGGRRRSGFSTADTFISLSDGALPDAIAWIGRWWYLPAFLVVVAWATVFALGHRVLRLGGVALTVIGMAMWWLFIWAGDRWNVINIQTLGPVVATTGMSLVALACGRQRHSLIRTGSHQPN